MKITAIDDEDSWHHELKALKSVALILLQDVETLESVCCLDIKSEISFYSEVENFEVKLIKCALLSTGGSQVRSAALLGVSLSNLGNKIKRYHIAVDSFRGDPLLAVDDRARAGLRTTA